MPQRKRGSQAESIDDRIQNAIKAENIENCSFNNIVTNGQISISGDDNEFNNVTLIEPGRFSISGERNILRNVRRVKRK
jgi:hypothetical protein